MARPAMGVSTVIVYIQKNGSRFYIFVRFYIATNLLFVKSAHIDVHVDVNQPILTYWCI